MLLPNLALREIPGLSEIFYKYNEQELLQQVAVGDEIAYKQLYLQYWDTIYSTAMMYTKSPDLSEDLTQDVFARIWVNRAKLAEVERFEGFLFIMARNIILNRLKKEVYVARNDLFFEAHLKESHGTPAQLSELRELQDKIETAIRTLPAQQERAFRLSRFSGMTHQQIAEEMGIAEQTVKAHIVRALQKLRSEFSDIDLTLSLAIWIFLFL